MVSAGESAMNGSAEPERLTDNRVGGERMTCGITQTARGVIKILRRDMGRFDFVGAESPSRSDLRNLVSAWRRNQDCSV